MIVVEKPCSENWNEMTPKERGRFCDKCCKVVVDFTKKTKEQIIAFLQMKKTEGERVCGRFRTAQITVPVKTVSRFSRRNIFLAALYFVFGSVLFTSCHTQGEPGHITGDSIAIDSTVMANRQAALQKDSTRIADSLYAVSQQEVNATVYKLAKADSARVADSVARSQNSVRDFK